MDDDEKDQQDGAAGEAEAVVGDLDVLGGEDRRANFLNSINVLSARLPSSQLQVALLRSLVCACSRGSYSTASSRNQVALK